jgi:hypothetical protein
MKLYSFIKSERTSKTLGGHKMLEFDLHYNPKYGKDNKDSYKACYMQFYLDDKANPVLIIHKRGNLDIQVLG